MVRFSPIASADAVCGSPRNVKVPVVMPSRISVANRYVAPW